MIESNTTGGHRILCDTCGDPAGSFVGGGDSPVLAAAYKRGFSFDATNGTDRCGPCARVHARYLVPHR